MIDHILGRPSNKSRRLQVLTVLSVWSLYLYRGNNHGPKGAQTLSKFFSKRLTAWQTFLITMLYLYAARNFSALVGLASPEPMANMYDTEFFRATWILTALDAGFWTAMKIRTKWLRDMMSIVFTGFYLISTQAADEKVRKVRSAITVEHMRVSWNKVTTPYLFLLSKVLRPRLTRWPPRQVRIPRPSSSDYTEPVTAWLYYDGPLAELENVDKVILDIPGGGFVAMDPRCNDDKLFAWAARTSYPILSLDYKKAPEFPYPYALNECFDVYTSLIRTRGRCIGMSGRRTPRIIMTGDSAGGNLAVAATLMILETSTRQRRPPGDIDLPPPEGMVCFYPALDVNIGNWMSDDQMALIQDRNMRQMNKGIVRRKSQQYNDLIGTTRPSSDEDDATPDSRSTPDGLSSPDSKSPTPEFSRAQAPSLNAVDGPPAYRRDSVSHHVEPIKTRLAVSSIISYFNDRMLTPEMMRAMIILYIGPHNRPDFATEYLLSPVLAPEALLAKFPKTFIMTGERDPLVDDTVIFASRLRRAKEAAARAKRGAGSVMSSEDVEDLDLAEVMLLPGISHGFMQFAGLYPPSWKHFDRSAVWFDQLFAHAEHKRARANRKAGGVGGVIASSKTEGARHHRRLPSHAESSGDEGGLEISMTKMSRGRASTVSQAGPEKRVASPEIMENTNSDPQEKRGQRGPKTLGKNKSLVRLGSADDLLGRRMQGLATNLTGLGDDD